ncbi:MAG: hypothetical protein AOA66_1686 [Candidatus Bathyarchaeota archaeon BA2]|nr:MAG: hypothetical protein AOA66_1686 [Candidatus Bathyarchaeota archaeon BA2]
MVKNMSQQTTKLFLPFAIPAEDRSKAFTRDMEMAAVFYLAEAERGKGGGRILKKTAEELIFIAEACYPVWLVPWNGRTLTLDGLNATSHTLSYDVLPDINAFDNDIQRSAETREAYSAALSNNADYFQSFAGKEEKTIESLIANPDFIRDLVSYLPEAEKIEKPVANMAFLSSTMDESAISTIIEELSNFRAKLREEIDSLGKSMNLLSTTTKQQVRIIHEEIREIEKKFDEEIEKVRPKVMESVHEIQRRCDVEITRASKKFELQLRRLHKDSVKLEKKHERLNAEIDRYEAGIKSCRLRKDEGGELTWRQKLKISKKELQTLQKSIRDMNKKIEDAETAKKLDISNLRLNYDAKVEEAMRDLRELEASREARIRMKQQEIKSLEDTTPHIIDQMNEMMKLKKAALKELDEIGAPETRRKYALVYLPLYIACYETEQKKRYIVYPPSVVGSIGILTKLKGVFRATKMKSFLQPRSKAVTTFLSQLVALIQENPVFEKEISDAGIQVSILRTKGSRELVKKGLEELKEEKWISESELQTFSKLL